jgi:hypothetical protein
LLAKQAPRPAAVMFLRHVQRSRWSFGDFLGQNWLLDTINWRWRRVVLSCFMNEVLSLTGICNQRYSLLALSADQTLTPFNSWLFGHSIHCFVYGQLWYAVKILDSSSHSYDGLIYHVYHHCYKNNYKYQNLLYQSHLCMLFIHPNNISI